jgi:hypothetical protein
VKAVKACRGMMSAVVFIAQRSETDQIPAYL